MRLDYFEMVNPETLDPVENISGGALVAVAAYVGNTRLIDNILLGKISESRRLDASMAHGRAATIPIGGSIRCRTRSSTCVHNRGSHSLCMWLGVKVRSNQEAPSQLHRLFLVIETVVAENLRLRIVRGCDLGAAMNQTVRLVEIHRRGDVLRDDAVILPRLGDAVDLYSQQHRDSGAIQFARQHHDRGRSPTVAKENDVRPRLFFVAENAVVIAVEQTKDRVVSGLPVAVLEDPNVGIFRKTCC